MTNAKDITLNDTGDLLFVNGDFVANYSDARHQEHLIGAFKGFYKAAPSVGVGIFQYLKSAGTAAEIKREITIELEADKYLVNKVDVTTHPDLTIKIDAERIS